MKLESLYKDQHGQHSSYFNFREIRPLPIKYRTIDTLSHPQQLGDGNDPQHLKQHELPS